MRSIRAALPICALCLATTAAPARAAETVTSFEFTELTGEFRVGIGKHMVTFLNGRAQTIGVPSLYTSGIHAWMIPPGATGVVTFATAAGEVELFIRDQSAGVSSELRVFDTAGALITSINGVTTGFTPVALTRNLASELPIGRIEFENNGAAGFAVMDDFTYCVANFPRLGNHLPSIQPGNTHVALTTIATDLTAPNWGASPPGQPDLLFVSDQSGELWRINTITAARDLFLDASARLVPLGAFGPGSFDERGLLGFAFHPDYQNNGLIYTYTSEPDASAPDFSTIPPSQNPNHQAVIGEWRTMTVPPDPNAIIDPTSFRELLRVDQPQFNHNAGAINFGPDDMLYIAFGDGGARDDQDVGNVFGHGLGNGPNRRNPLGAVLRIDPQGNNAANGQYGIPADNPFVGEAGVVEEIYAFGFRNPFRFSFDSATGDLWLADVGQGFIEEVDIVTAGGDYGWNFYEGSSFFVPDGNQPGFITNVNPGAPLDAIPPVAEYDHEDGIAIIGGFVYRGERIPPLAGRYVFGEFAATFSNDGRLFHLDANDTIVEFNLIGQADFGHSLLGMGQDGHGELYALVNQTGTPFGDTGAVLRIDLRVGDATGDGEVTLSDLAALLASFGLSAADPGFLPAADFTLDGVVDLADLAALLAAFGA